MKKCAVTVRGSHLDSLRICGTCVKNVNLSVENDRTAQVIHSPIERGFYNYILAVEIQMYTE